MNQDNQTIHPKREQFMKKIIFLVCFLILTGCAKQPVIANLNLRLGDQTMGGYSADSSAVIIGQDTRKSSDVVIYLSDNPPTGLANMVAVQELISARITDGFRNQGLGIAASSPVQLKFNIKELGVKVSRPKMLYMAEAKTFITLTVENRGTVFTKTYTREANRESATRPDLPELEEMLNGQMSGIVQQMLQDEEVRQLVARQ